MKTILSIALLASLISCGKKIATKKASSSESENLTTKTDDEILLLKYNNEVDLKCDLRLFAGRYVDLSTDPDMSFTWQLKKELINSKLLRYTIHNLPLVLIVRLDSPLQVLEEKEFVGVDGQKYYMENTPMLSIRYEVLTQKEYEDGVRSDFSSLPVVTLAENVTEPVFSMVTEPVGGSAMGEDFRCTLRTNPKPEYKSQWKSRR